MAINFRRLGVLAVLIAVISLAVFVLSFSYVEVGITDKIGTGGLVLTDYGLANVPQSVAEDAANMAKELYGNNWDKYNDFFNQLLSSYAEAEDTDIVVIFNSGGWGWNYPDSSPGWTSILNGIQSELDNLGCDLAVLNYRRTSETLWGVIKEFGEVATSYPTKAKDLARRVEFLTTHNPDIRVIVAGESNGSVISDSMMSILEDNPQVYSIQTGNPFWYSSTNRERTLLMNDNGMVPDSFSRGDVYTMLWASVKSVFKLPTHEEEPGTIGNYIRAPGHDYSWQYPQVVARVEDFLGKNFGTEH
ncbi:hypothetical protein ACFLXD_01395 [Chloroflexota bacterium]